MSRTRPKPLALLKALLAVALLVACNPAAPLMAELFVPLPPSSAKVKQPLRHPPPPKPQVIEVVREEIVVPPTIDWQAIYQTLPRDSKGNVDWMQALAENLIAPKPGIAADATPASTMDSEITFTPTDNPGKAATFRHATHTSWLSCKNCHPAVFKKRDENLQFTHDDMDKGEYCGACHFTVVFVPSGCKGCHAAKKPAAAASAAAS